MHVSFTEHKTNNYRPDYIFNDIYTNEVIAYGTYCEDGFQIVNNPSFLIEIYPTAAVAFVALNKRLQDDYGY